jgi:hypothetical protein
VSINNQSFGATAMFYLPEEFVNEHNELDNILVEQKNALIRMIDSGEINEALAALRILRPLWQRLQYDYKYLELQNRAHAAVNAQTFADTIIGE